MGLGSSVRAVCLATAIILLPGQAPSEEPPPFPKFTFKRVKPPPPDADRRINVQVTSPAETANAESGGAAATAANQVAARAQSYDWFWAGISPEEGQGGAGRMLAAVDRLAAAPPGQALDAPSLQDLRNAAAAYGRDILVSTIGTRVSPALVLAVMGVESRGRADAVSRAGAVGLMQLMPETARAYGLDDPTDPAGNIRVGVQHLAQLLDAYDGDPIVALAAYNAGQTAVRENGGVPPFPETRAYVPKVVAAWAVARMLCQTPPELITDGCVFDVAAN